MKKYKELHNFIIEQPELQAYQKAIDSGIAFKLEGSWGRTTMDYLKSGLLLLPEKSFTDYWGNVIPAYTELQAGMFGTPEFVADKIDEQLNELRNYDDEN